MSRFERRESSLLVPRERMILPRGVRGRPSMGAPQQAILMSPSSFGPNLVRMSFEAANNAQVFYDSGAAGSIWTPSGANIHITNGAFKDGATALAVDAAADNLSAPVSAKNAITTVGFGGGWFWPFGSSAQLASKSLFAIDDLAGSAAGSAWGYYTNSSRVPTFIYSDGVTRGSISGGSAVTSGTPVYLSHEIVSGTTVYFKVNGAAVGSAALSAFNVPASRFMTLGSAATGVAGMIMYADIIEVIPNAVHGSSNFTPQASPWS